MRITDTTVALVTGGASGLGGATTRRLAADGAQVVIVDLASSPGAALAEELGERVRFVPADVRDEARSRRPSTRRGRSVSCGSPSPAQGSGRPAGWSGATDRCALADFQRTIDINLVGTFNVLRLAAVAMLDNEPVDGDRGLVVMTASIAAYDGQIGQAAYAASKGGVVALTLTAARDLADKLVRVVTIAPGTFATPMLAGLPDEATAALEAGIPHPSRLGKPEEYAALVRHVVDNGMLNGEVIRLDGALRMPPR